MDAIWRNVSDASYFHIWGIAGTAVILIGCLIASVFYKGRDGERYNPLNHFISELGEHGISRLAPVFNIGLILGGLLNAVFMAQLGRFLGTTPALVFAVVGVIGSLACVAVGLFPLNHFTKHIVSATTFFYGGMLTVAVFAIAMFLEESSQIPRAFAVFAVTVAAVFILFLTVMRFAVKKGVDFHLSNIKRPSFWVYPLLEWIVMLSVSSWILAVSIYVIR